MVQKYSLYKDNLEQFVENLLKMMFWSYQRCFLAGEGKVFYEDGASLGENGDPRELADSVVSDLADWGHEEAYIGDMILFFISHLQELRELNQSIDFYQKDLVKILIQFDSGAQKTKPYILEFLQG